MNVVFNNPVLYVVDYPAMDAIEVIDKRKGVGTLMRGETAHRFRRELEDVVSGEGGDEDFGDFIDHYGSLLNQPAVYH